MSLPPGTKLGPYEIHSKIGAGGMGEVYKARDPKLDRFVAIKVLPQSLAGASDLLARFEREARAVAALNHPNILGIYDFGPEGEHTYAVMELLEGESLRNHLKGGPLTPRKATELAIQMAQGLAAAHDKGVIHRDLKPENLWITKEGRLKILDFGLAKQMAPLNPNSGSSLETGIASPGRAVHTEGGLILGTLGYMSPEQVRGEAVDARSDIFSFGVVLFEMLTGQQAFVRSTASDSLAAILRDDPLGTETTGTSMPLGLRRIIDHCLEKNPAKRFHDANDLAFALEAAADPSSASQAPFAPPTKPPKRSIPWKVVAGIGWVVTGASLLAWGLRGPDPKPTFKRLTFGKGTVDGARFAPGSTEVVFSARWNGEPPEVFTLNPAALEPRSLGVRGGTLLSVSHSGELALKMNPRLWAGFEVGQLARVTPAGGLRIIQEEVFESDWLPDGRELALVAAGAGALKPAAEEFPRMTTLEFPEGRPLANEVPFTWGIRVSPSGDRLACFEQPTFNQGDGRIVAVDRKGTRTILAEAHGFTGLAWGPDGRDIWFTEFRDGASSLWALTTSGQKRLLLRQAGLLELLDVARNGRVLASLSQVVKGAIGMNAPDFREKDLSWNEATFAHDISPDGKQLLIGTAGNWSSQGERLALYLRKSDEAVPTRLGEAAAARFMPNGRQVLASLIGERGAALSLIPLGPGQPQVLDVPELKLTPFAEPLPDGRRAIITGAVADTFQLLDLATGTRTPLEEPGISGTANVKAISPDGAWGLVRKLSGKLLDSPYILVSTQGAPSRAVKGIEAGEVPLRWNTDGTSIYVFNRDGLPTRIQRVELATGKRTLVREIMPANPGGLPGIRSFAMTPDAQHLAYNYVRKLSDLYLIEGLK